MLLVPYQRPTRHVPWVTYALMAVNTLIFLITVLVANYYLPVDRIAGQKYLSELLSNHESLRLLIKRYTSVDPTNEEIDQFLARLDEQKRWQIAMQLAFEQASDASSYQRLWQLQNADATFVLEPHYSTLDLFAYHPSEASGWRKIVGIIGSMFLHGGLDHIIGNMLFLWLFGRLLEDALGPIIYLGAYLVAGFAAVLLFHIITMQFTPESAGVPLMGASGAIAGVMGLFTIRFYRTSLRIPPFCVGLLGLAACNILLGKIGLRIGLAVSVFLLARITAAGFQQKWPGIVMRAAWAMSGYVLLFDVWPAIRQLMGDESGGVAHWAHIGGYGFGMAYALAIGARDEGAAEYMLDDAQKAVSEGDSADALRRSQALISGEQKGAHSALPSMKAQAFEVQAAAYAKQGNKDAAQENFENAILSYLGDNNRDAATRVFLTSLEHYPLFILPPAKLLVIASHLAERGQYEKAAENLDKIPYAFPDAPESEVAALRAARLHLEKLDNAPHAIQLLQWFVARYPHSDWMQQAQRLLQAAQTKAAHSATERG